MNWVDQILQKIFRTKEVHVTFKGKATTDPFEIIELDRGWQDGYDYTMKNYKWRKPFKFPDLPGYWGNGWAEGYNYARSKLYHEWWGSFSSLSLQENGDYEITYPDGRKIIV